MYQIKKKSKKQNFHGDLAHSLIQIAVYEIEQANSLDFSLRELSKKLGVSHAAVYRHFKDKEALLTTIALQGFLKLGSCFREAIESKGATLEVLGKSYIDFALQNPGFYRVMFSINLPKKEFDNKCSIENSLSDASIETFYFLLDIIGKRTSLNVKKAIIVWSVVHGWVMLRLSGQVVGLVERFDTTEQEVDLFLRQSINAIYKLN